MKNLTIDDKITAILYQFALTLKYTYGIIPDNIPNNALRDHIIPHYITEQKTANGFYQNVNFSETH
jgi:hypothetical protein